MFNSRADPLVRKLRAFLLILLCHGSLLATAVAPAPRWASMSSTVFKHTQSPIAAAIAIAQDRSGFLWFATQSGLFRWDGQAFRRYTADSGKPRALPDDYILSVHVDAGGTLWAGTSSGGLARYAPASDDFTVIGTGPAGLSDRRVAAMADDGAGGIWIGTTKGLDHISAAGRLTQATQRILPAAAAGSPERAIEALWRDRAGDLWIGTREGLQQLRAGAASATPVRLTAQGEKAPPINALLQDSAGRIWIGTRNMGAFVIEAGSEQARAVKESGAGAALHKQRVFSIAEVSPGKIWFGTEGGGIVELDPASGHTRRIRHLPDVQDSLPDDDVYSVFRERGGVMVVGSTETFSIHDPRPQAIVTVRDAGLPLQGKFTAPSVLVRPDGSIWAGVAGGGIDIVDARRGGVGQLKPGGAGGLPTGRVLAMVNGPDGAVYAGTQQGLYRVGADGQVRRVPVPQRGATESAWALAYRDGVLWMGGLDGLWALALGAGGAPPTVLRHERDSLGDSRVTALLPLEGGGVWIGTRAGLARLASATAPVDTVPSGVDGQDRMMPGYTSSLALDRQGRLWLSSFGRGIQVLERTDGDGRRHFRLIEAAHGLPDNSVNALLADRDGVMWASTDKGLARIDPASFAVRALGPAEGVHITQYWTNAAALTGEGELLFGGISGLTVVRPERLAPIANGAPVVVTDILLNDRALPAARFNLPSAAAPAPIQITPDGKERGFSMEFALLDYSASDQIQYAYRLLGFDSDWIRTVPGSRRLAYTNLPPGDYTMQMRAARAGGGWSPALSVPVRALPSWHQTAWVRILALLFGAGCVAALVRLRTAYYRRRQAELENTVAQRTAELQASQTMLEHLAYADPLTGLPNRRLFNDELRHKKAQAARDHTPFTLLLIDLDHFKRINDTLGHDAGDALLIEVAKRLQMAVREADRLARLGGDEFAVLLSHTYGEEIVDVVARRIVDSVSEPIPFGEHSMRVGASIGAATYHGGADETLYKQADLALYQAKESGRNTWVWYRQAHRDACPT